MKINLRILFPFILSSICFYTITAKTPEYTKAFADSIKLSEAYIYGEDSDECLAFDNALIELTAVANDIRGKAGKVYISPTDLKPITEEIKYRRGRRPTTLVYVSIHKMLDIGVNVNSAQPTQSQNNISQLDTFATQPQTTSTTIMDEVTKTICQHDNWIEIKGFITSFKQAGKIAETGTATSLDDVPDDAYSILIDEMYGIQAILTPRKNPNRIDCRTKRPDTESNHPNFKIIVWYK